MLPTRTRTNNDDDYDDDDTQNRGFGFVTFLDATSVEKVLANGPHELDGKRVDPKIAFPKRSNPKVSNFSLPRSRIDPKRSCLDESALTNISLAGHF